MSDYRIDLKVRNNRILKLMQSLGYDTVASLKRADSRINQAETGAIINFKKSPLLKDGSWKQQVLYLCDVLICHPTDLFTDAQEKFIINDKKYLEVSEDEIRKIKNNNAIENYNPISKELSKKIKDAFDLLTNRESEILMMCYGFYPYDKEYTLREVGDHFDISRCRVGQIRNKALRKLSRKSSKSALMQIIE